MHIKRVTTVHTALQDYLFIGSAGRSAPYHTRQEGHFASSWYDTPHYHLAFSALDTAIHIILAVTAFNPLAFALTLPGSAYAD